MSDSRPHKSQDRRRSRLGATDPDGVWVMRVAQSVLRSSAVPPTVADLVGREIAKFLSDPEHMQAAMAAYGTDDALEIANLITRDGIKHGIGPHLDRLWDAARGKS